MIYRLVILLLLNFGALAIGGIFTGKGVPSAWYVNLEKAPWTPPGWVFGTAWTTIMICFSIYLTLLWPKITNKKFLIALFTVQWFLNTGWNPVFFYFHETGIALTVILLLTILVAFFLFHYSKNLRVFSLFILPYLVWLLIATSLNAYIVLKN